MKYVLLIPLVVFLFFGCASSHTSNTLRYRYGASTGDVSSEDFTSKIQYSASLSMTVEQPDSTNAQLERIAARYRGYLQEKGSLSTVILVQSESLQDALEEIVVLGKVSNKRISSKNVTGEYYDYKIRLENAKKSRDRYLELLKQAENVEAALLVEKELERLTETIDLLTGKMNRIDHLTDYSMITIYLREKRKPGLLGYVGLGIYHAVKWLFVRN